MCVCLLFLATLHITTLIFKCYIVTKLLCEVFKLRRQFYLSLYLAYFLLSIFFKQNNFFIWSKFILYIFCTSLSEMYTVRERKIEK